MKAEQRNLMPFTQAKISQKIEGTHMIKIDKQEVNKINNFCFSKDVIKKIMSQITLWEKIFAVKMSDKIHTKTMFVILTTQK